MYNSLINEPTYQKKEVVNILLDDIIPNRFQPRLTFDMEALGELAQSIKEHGVIQPLIVRHLQDKYEIIAGERRYKASSLAGLKEVPCIIMDLDDNEAAIVAVIENIQRKEMTPLEEAKSFKKILDKGFITQDELAKKMGKNQSTIANKLRLLNLDDTVQDAILNEKISERHARSLLKIEDAAEQRNMLKEIIEKRLTVRQLDEIIKERYDKKEENMNFNNNDVINQNPVFAPISNNMDNNEIFKNEEQNINKEVINESNVNNKITNAINNLDNNTISSNNQSLNIFKYDNGEKQNDTVNDVLNPSVYNSGNNTPNSYDNSINSVLNPSVFTVKEEKPVEQVPTANMVNLNEFSNNIDINNIKSNSQDIIPKEETVSVNTLMSSNGIEKPINKFVMDIGNYKETVDDFKPQLDKINIEVNNMINKLKLEGIYLESETVLKDNKYEIILRINK